MTISQVQVKVTMGCLSPFDTKIVKIQRSSTVKLRIGTVDYNVIRPSDKDLSFDMMAEPDCRKDLRYAITFIHQLEETHPQEPISDLFLQIEQ